MRTAAMPLHQSGILRPAPPPFNRIGVAWRKRHGQILFTYLHLAPDPEQTGNLVQSGAICIAYETVTAPGVMALRLWLA